MSQASPRDRRRSKTDSPQKIVRRFCVDVLQTIEQRNILRGGETAVLAVSGGADSLSLLEAMVRLRDSLRVTLHVAHCDRGIRPSSPDDADFVQARAAEHGLGFHLGHADPKPPKGRSLEEHLRDQRGAFLIGIANEVGAARILTGHTLDDQAETVLMNLLT
ncbi:MAG: ATP-binding protein, partial [Actinomycetota bacterium]